MNTIVKNEVMLPEFVSQLIRIAKSEGMNNDSNDIERSLANMLQNFRLKLLL